jgi:hypothetical protein
MLLLVGAAAVVASAAVARVAFSRELPFLNSEEPQVEHVSWMNDTEER